MNWLTIAVIVFLVLMTVFGAKRGLVKTVLSLTAFALALVIVAFAHEPVANMLRENTGIYDSIEEGITQFIEGRTQNASETGEEIIDQLQIPGILKQSLAENNSKAMYSQLGVKKTADYVVAWLTNLAFGAITYLITFVGAWIILKIVTIILDHLTKLPVIHQLNSFAGAVIGFLIGMIIVWVGGLIVTAFASAEWGRQALAMIQQSSILSFLYNNNIFVNGVIKTIGSLGAR